MKHIIVLAALILSACSSPFAKGDDTPLTETGINLPEFTNGVVDSDGCWDGKISELEYHSWERFTTCINVLPYRSYGYVIKNVCDMPDKRVFGVMIDQYHSNNNGLYIGLTQTIGIDPTGNGHIYKIEYVGSERAENDLICFTKKSLVHQVVYTPEVIVITD